MNVNVINKNFWRRVLFNDVVSDILARLVSMFIGFWGGRAFFYPEAYSSLCALKIGMLSIGVGASVMLIFPIIDKLRKSTKKTS